MHARNKIENRQNDNENKNSIFVDLAPIDNADIDGSYENAIIFALGNEKIKNIAITGPYGSGKSSIINTFEKRYSDKYGFFNISLASFKEDTEENEENDTEETYENEDKKSRHIERSILQQLIYGCDQKKIPYSRFKQIKPPEFPLFKSTLFIVWLSIITYAYKNGSEIIQLISGGNGFLFTSTLMLVVGFTGAIPAVLIADAYRATFGISLKRISLKNAEIETGDLTENSILNRYIDEIIYFFQENEYNIVVIEDLDRFGNPEIFVKLREINKLVNDNIKTNGNIKFIYALKDDMFIHKSRTKFFDFIIPVVPIINSSNSLDMIKERAKSSKIENELKDNFLREVSFYIDDLRLINNIFNEFNIYYDRISSKNINITKLLSMMIYKNVYPHDFEKLHHNDGQLYKICSEKNKKLQETKISIEKEITDLKSKIREVQKEKAYNAKELISIYLGHIILEIGTPIYGFIISNNVVTFNKLKEIDIFKKLKNEKTIRYAKDNNNNRLYWTDTNLTFSELEKKVCATESFDNRLNNINRYSTKEVIEIQRQINRHEKEIRSLSTKKLSYFIKDYDLEISNKTSNSKVDNRLFSYLIKNELIDETYYLYTSNFHEGRMTSRDRDFIISVRNDETPSPTQEIDTPKEVCASLREEDFGCKYILNIYLIDYLLENIRENPQRLNLAILYISENYSESIKFLDSYFVLGRHPKDFTRQLCRQWPEFGSTAINSDIAVQAVSNILNHVDKNEVCDKINKDLELTDFINHNGYSIFCSELNPPSDLDLLKLLKVKFISINELEQNRQVFEYSYNNNLYTISSNNILHILSTNYPEHNSNDYKSRNYSFISESELVELKTYIEENIIDYIKNVFLEISTNTNESEVHLIKLLKNDELSIDLKKDIIEKESYIFENIDKIDKELWEAAIQLKKLKITWSNLSKYYSIEERNEDVILSALKENDNIDELINSKPCIKNDCKQLYSYIINNNEIDDETYGTLLPKIPYKYKTLPNVSEEKIKIFINKNKAALTDRTLEAAARIDSYVTYLLVKSNIIKYFEEKDKYYIDDDVRLLLLESNIETDYKVSICHDVSSDGSLKKELAKNVLQVLSKKDVDCSNISDDVLTAAIISTTLNEDFIRLLIKCIPNWSEDFTMSVISRLPHPYKWIASYKKRPSLLKTDLTLEFADLLKHRNFISSVTIRETKIVINTKKYPN